MSSRGVILRRGLVRWYLARNMDAAAELKEWRLRSHTSQAALARAVGLARAQAISNIECGRTIPSLRVACAIESKTGIPPRAWLGGT